MQRQQHILGCLLGTAVGDAIGLPREGLSRRRARRIFGRPPLRHALVLRRGMCSDDTEHTVMVAQAYLEAGGDPERFARCLAARLRWWLMRIPAGVGLATLRACLRLWVGFPASRSGVRSAGNGPAMRSAILGVLAGPEPLSHGFVDASSCITHTDPRAVQGARIVAQAAQWAARCHAKTDHTDPRTLLLPLAEEAELHTHMTAMFHGVEQGRTPAQIADTLGLSKGVTGYINHTVPMAVCCWLAHRLDGQDALRNTIESAVDLGGDSDTVAAIAGALAGAEFGPNAIPDEWLDGLCEWPATKRWLTGLADALGSSATTRDRGRAPSLNSVARLLRNLVFTAIVLTHGFRRLLPPY